MSERWLGPAEMARRLGVSPKALRVYERGGMVKPLRTAAGWRTYGPAQAARLHQVLALKALGLPLRRIAELVNGDLDSLDSVLRLQERALRARKTESERGLSLLAAARASLARCGSLSLDDLTNLTRETVMNERLNLTDGSWGEAIKPLIDKHYTPEQLERLAARSAEVEAAGYDQSTISHEWEVLFAEAGTLREAGDASSARATELARRWIHMSNLFTHGEPDMAASAQAVWGEVTADPALGPRMPDVPDLFRFVGVIVSGMKARGEAVEPLTGPGSGSGVI